MDKKDGGPAFPDNIKDGMTLRDYFAGQALVAEITTACLHEPSLAALIEGADTDGQSIVQRLAFNSYQVADAMLAARSAPPAL